MEVARDFEAAEGQSKAFQNVPDQPSTSSEYYPQPAAAVSTITKTDLAKLRKDRAIAVLPTDRKLRAYGGSTIQTWGRIHVNLSVNSNCIPEYLYIVDEQTSLLSEEASMKLGLVKLTCLPRQLVNHILEYQRNVFVIANIAERFKQAKPDSGQGKSFKRMIAQKLPDTMVDRYARDEDVNAPLDTLIQFLFNEVEYVKHENHVDIHGYLNCFDTLEEVFFEKLDRRLENLKTKASKLNINTFQPEGPRPTKRARVDKANKPPVTTIEVAEESVYPGEEELI
ncbi:hypothetical protein BLOT_001626 [Blomia tropicalis]|nr:hypothetical protein BLOT_001626 [Blomia tropicalis]